MRYILPVVFIAFSIALSAQGFYTNEDGEKQQWGEITVQDLKKPPFDVWFNESQKYYSPKVNEKVVQKIKSTKDLEVLIYMGTWCSDSQDWVPKFVKLWTSMGLDMDHVKIIGVHDADDKRKHAPDGSHEKYEIEYVPTFIFLEGGKEIGRIVEYPQAELEDDVAAIVQGKA